MVSSLGFRTSLRCWGYSRGLHARRYHVEVHARHLVPEVYKESRTTIMAFI